MFHTGLVDDDDANSDDYYDDYDDCLPKESLAALADVSIKMFPTGLVSADGTGRLHHHNHHIAL